jgi:hypothetical protein
VYLKLQCDDYGGPVLPDNDYNDKIVEVFFPLVYGIDFLHLGLARATNWRQPGPSYHAWAGSTVKYTSPAHVERVIYNRYNVITLQLTALHRLAPLRITTFYAIRFLVLPGHVRPIRI